MLNLFFSMIKEEWRIHSTMFGSLSFALFPVMMAGIAFMGTFLIPLVRSALPPGYLSLILHANYLLLGIMVGSFGILGNEVMNRRFGQASLISYSVKILPFSERFIFANFVAKDILYYFVLWVLPFSAGFVVASGLTGIPLYVPSLLLCTLTLSFMTGLSLVFFLSTIYMRTKTFFTFILLFILALAGYFFITAKVNPAFLYPPLLVFRNFSWTFIIGNILLILAFLILSFVLFLPDYSGSKKEFQNHLSPLTEKLRFLPCPILSAKDFMDLKRSGSLVGQSLFSFLLPLFIMWFFHSLLADFIPLLQILFSFAILTGVIASTMYTWLTMFDNYNTYSYLPVSVPDLITAKVSEWMLLQLLPVVFIVLVCQVSGKGQYTLPVLVLTESMAFYALGVTIWLTGLSPGIFIYSVRVMAMYFLFAAVPFLLFSSLASISPWYALSALVLIIPALIFISKGKIKWEMREQPIY